MNRIACALLLLLVISSLSFAQVQTSSASPMTLEEQYMQVEPAGEEAESQAPLIMASSAEGLKEASVASWKSGQIDDYSLLQDIDALTQKPGQPPPVPESRAPTPEQKVCKLKSHMPWGVADYYYDTFDARSDAYGYYQKTYLSFFHGNTEAIKANYSKTVDNERKSFLGKAEYQTYYGFGALESGQSTLDVVLDAVKAIYGPTTRDFILKDYVPDELYGIGFVMVGAPAGFLGTFNDVLQASAYLMGQTLDSIIEWYHNVQDATNIYKCYEDFMAYRHDYEVYNETPAFGVSSLSEMQYLAGQDADNIDCIKIRADSDWLLSWRCEEDLVKRMAKEYRLLKEPSDGVIHIGGWESSDWPSSLGSSCSIQYVQELMQPVSAGLESYGEADAGRLGNMYVRYALDVCVEPSDVDYSSPIVGRSFAFDVPISNVGHGTATNVKAYVYDSAGNLLGQSKAVTVASPMEAGALDALAPPTQRVLVGIDTKNFQLKEYNFSIIVTGENTWTGAGGLTLATDYDFFKQNNVYNLSLTFSNYPPPAPSIRLGYYDNESANVYWGKCSESDFKEFRVYQTDELGGNKRQLLTIKDNAQNNEAWIENLTPGTDYYFVVAAVDRFNAISYSNVVNLKTLESTTLRIEHPENIDYDSVPLRWTQINRPDMNAYVVCRSTRPFTNNRMDQMCEGAVSFISDWAKSSTTVKSLSPNTTYYFRVDARYNVSGSDYYLHSNVVTAKTNASSAPVAVAEGPEYEQPVWAFVNETFYVTANRSVGFDYPLAAYAWDFNNDGVFEFSDKWANVKPIARAEEQEGVYVYTLMVNDTVGRYDTDTLTVNIHNPDFTLMSIAVPDGRIYQNSEPGIISVQVDDHQPHRETANWTLNFYDNGTLFARNSAWKLTANWTPKFSGMHNITVILSCPYDLHPEDNRLSAQKFVLAEILPDAGVESLSAWPAVIRQYDSYDAYAIVKVVGDIAPPKGIFKATNDTSWNDQIVSDAPYQQWIFPNMTAILEKLNDTPTAGIAPAGAGQGTIDPSKGPRLRETTLYDELNKQRVEQQAQDFGGLDAVNGAMSNDTGTTTTGAPAGLPQASARIPEDYKKIPIRWWVYHARLTTGKAEQGRFDFELDPDRKLKESDEVNNYMIYFFKVNPALPSVDLIIDKIEFSRDVFGEGQHVLTVAIKNIGRNFSGPFKHDVRVGNATGVSMYGEDILAGLAGGDTYTYSKTGPSEFVSEETLEYYNYVMCAVVDIMKQVDEKNETNNYKCTAPALAPEPPAAPPSEPPPEEPPPYTPPYPPYNTSGG